MKPESELPGNPGEVEKEKLWNEFDRVFFYTLKMRET